MSSVDTSTVAGRLAEIRAAIGRACEQSGRDPGDVTLIGVTKTFSVDSIAEAMAAGLRDFGENRVQELLPKAEDATARGLQPRWHFIGHLQRNKVREVLPHIAALHSLDSIRLATTVNEERERHTLAELPCYIEVNVGGETSKEGIAPSALPALLDALGAMRQVSVVGLMTVAPQVNDPEQVRPVFRSLRALAHAHGLAGLSMGMSEDYTVAVEEGATAVRVGRALFGARS
ncbi:MAG: YggS family pyridoxal phosphate-dependent enzyme [Dehalococcoidia bacterium]